MDYSHLDFVEAVEDLADFVGVQVPRESSNSQVPAKKNNTAEIFQVLEQVAGFIYSSYEKMRQLKSR